MGLGVGFAIMLEGLVGGVYTEYGNITWEYEMRDLAGRIQNEEETVMQALLELGTGKRQAVICCNRVDRVGKRMQFSSSGNHKVLHCFLIEMSVIEKE